MTAGLWTPAELLPHKDSMVLLDEVVDAGEGWATAAVRIAEDVVFYEPGRGVPVWVGIEYMAQTVALYAGTQARRAGEPIRIGLLLGTRRYECHVAYFPLGTRLIVQAKESWCDDSMAVFDCRIDSDRCLAEARLNVYAPPNFSAFLDGHET